MERVECILKQAFRNNSETLLHEIYLERTFRNIWHVLRKIFQNKFFYAFSFLSSSAARRGGGSSDSVVWSNGEKYLSFHVIKGVQFVLVGLQKVICKVITYHTSF